MFDRRDAVSEAAAKAVVSLYRADVAVAVAVLAAEARHDAVEVSSAMRKEKQMPWLLQVLL